MIQLALYKGEGLIGNALIRWWTESPYSHCEIVVSGVCYSSSLMDKGVRDKQIDLHDGNWDLIDLPWASADKVLAYYGKTMDQPYGWADLFARQIFRAPSDDGVGQFCSEWCANALGLPDPRDHSPASLERLVRFINATCTD